MNFKEYRKKAGLTQQEAANALGVSRTSIIAWETGRAEPRTIAKLGDMANLYGCSVSDLLGEKIERERNNA